MAFQLSWLLPLLVVEAGAARPVEGNASAQSIFAGIADTISTAHASRTSQAGRLSGTGSVVSDSTTTASDSFRDVTDAPEAATTINVYSGAASSGNSETSIPRVTLAPITTDGAHSGLSRGDRNDRSATTHAPDALHNAKHDSDDGSTSGTAEGESVTTAVNALEDKATNSDARSVDGTSLTSTTVGARGVDAGNMQARDTEGTGTDATPANSRGCSREEHIGRLKIDCQSKVLRQDDAALFGGNQSQVDVSVWSVELAAGYIILPVAIFHNSVLQRFSMELQRLPQLSVLSMSLKHADLGQDEARRLLVSVSRLPLLEVLRLDFSSSLFFPEALDSEPALGSAGLGSLAACSKLVSLSLFLTGNGLGSHGARDLAYGLARLPNLRFLTLDVSMNAVQDVGAWELGASLGRLVHLSSLTLNLRLSSLTAAGLLELAEGLGRLKELTSLTLDVSYNEFGDTAASTLATSSLSDKLLELARGALVDVKLDLSGTGIGPVQAWHLGELTEQLRGSGTSMKVVGVLASDAVSSQRTPTTTTARVVVHTTAVQSGLTLAGTTELRTSELSTTASPVTSLETTSLAPSSASPVSTARPSALQVDTKVWTSAAPSLRTTHAAASLLPSTSLTVAPPSPAMLSSMNATGDAEDTSLDEGSKDGNFSDNSTANTTSVGLEGRNLEVGLLILIVLVAVIGGALAWGNGACSARARGREPGRGARMSMLGSDEQEDQRSPTRTSCTTPLSARREPKSMRPSDASHRSSEASHGNFADFASFSDNVPVVSSWGGGSSSSSTTRQIVDAFDGCVSDSLETGDALEAMLEAQVASLGDGSDRE